MNRRKGILCIAMLGLALPALIALQANERQDLGVGHWGEAVTADVLDPHTSQNLGAGDPAWEAFQERYPGEWQSTWDIRTRRPHWIYGPGIEVATGSLDDATAMIFASRTRASSTFVVTFS